MRWWEESETLNETNTFSSFLNVRIEIVNC